MFLRNAFFRHRLRLEGRGCSAAVQDIYCINTQDNTTTGDIRFFLSRLPPKQRDTHTLENGWFCFGKISTISFQRRIPRHLFGLSSSSRKSVPASKFVIECVLSCVLYQVHSYTALRNRNTDQSWISYSYLGKSAFYTNFSITALNFLISLES